MPHHSTPPVPGVPLPESHYRLFFHSTSDPAVIIDPEGTILDANRAYAERFRPEPGMIIGANIHELLEIDASELASVDEGKAVIREAVRTGEPGVIEKRLNETTVRYTVCPLIAEEGAVTSLLIHTRDLVPQHGPDAIQALYESILERCHFGTWLLNLQDGSGFNSAEQVRLFGFDDPQTEWNFERFLDHVLPVDRPMIVEKFRESITRETKWDVEYRIINHKGELRWQRDVGISVADEQGSVARLMGLTRDVTDIKAAACKQNALQTQWDFASRSCRLGLWLMELDSFTTIRNAEHARIFGYDTADEPWSFSRFMEHVLPEDRPEIERVFTEATVNWRDQQFECRIRRRNGELRWISIMAKFQFDHDGNARNLIGLTQDVTEKKAADAEREQLQERLRQSQKMDLVGQLAGGIAHDFNNILSVIQGNAELIRRQAGENQPFSKNIECINSAVDRSAEMVKQLLAFARKQPWNPKQIEIDHELERMQIMLRSLIRENIELRWHPGCSKAMVSIDPSNLVQIVTNLCVNSRDAIAEAGTVTIETAMSTACDNDDPADASAPSGGCVRISVSDTGSGIAPEDFPHIFEPFYTTKATGKGTGLGLSIVYGLVKQNGGHIACQSEPGKGTTFTIQFPLAVNAPDTGSGTPEKAAHAVKGDTAILLVEDEADIVTIVKTILEQKGFRVFASGSAEEAIELFEKEGKTINLVISDIVLPGMNGVQMSRELMKTNPAAKFIFMSGYSADAIDHYGVFGKGTNFISKPFGIREFMAMVQGVLEKKG